MQINVSQLLKSNIGTVRNYEIDTTVVIEGDELNFKGNVRLMKTDRGIIARAVLRSVLELQCSRCLCDYVQPLSISIEEEYFPSMDIVTGSDLPAPEEPGAFTIDDHNILDLTEAIRQYAVLAIPIKPLCKQDCSGLCPVCGTNLNEQTCNCTKPGDPRWEKLRDLLSTDSKDTNA